MPSERATDSTLTIGRFARLSGLSVGALRHYDELDILRPAAVDPFTGYRTYRAGQLDAARLIARLRSLEMPLDEIRQVLETDDPDGRRQLFVAHRTRIEARTVRLQRVLHQLGHLTRTPEAPMPEPPLPPELDPATRRSLAAGLFNRVWQLLETSDRTVEQDDEMVHAAHASRLHWEEVPDVTDKQRSVGEWQCSRVYAVLGRVEPARHHAQRAVAIAERGPAEDWVVAAAYEAMARALAIAGDPAAAEWRAKAIAATAAIADKDDREIIEQDLATLPT